MEDLFNYFTAEQWGIIGSISGVIGTAFAIFVAVMGWLFWTGKWLFRKKPTEVIEPEVLSTPETPKIAHYLNMPLGRVVIGREAELDQITETFSQGKPVVIWGQGGIGKSTLARAFAEQRCADYAGVLWVNAVNRQGVIDGLTGLCGPLAVEKPQAATESDALSVLAALAQTGTRWLLVYDNVERRDDIEGLIPQGSDLIVTTRQGVGWQGFAVMGAHVLPFDTEDGAAVRLLMDEAERVEDAAGARELAEVLGGLPLALVIAGGMIRKEGLGFGDYLTQVERIIAREPKNSGYPDSVIGAVRLSYGALSDDAKRVADVFAWWAAEGLEARLITDAPSGAPWGHIKDEIPEALQELAHSPERVVAAVEALEERSILRREGAGFALHRMSAAALRAMQGDEPLNGAAAALLAAVYPAKATFSGHWDMCRRLTPHVRGLRGSGAAPTIAAMDFLLNQAAVFLGTIGDVSGTGEMARAALTLTEARLPEEDREIAVRYANLGASLRQAGDLAAAEAALRKAVALHQAHRPDSVDLAESLNLLGGVLVDQGRAGKAGALTEALRSYQHAAAILRRHEGRLSAARAQALNNIGGVRDALGQGAAALRLYRYSLDIRRQVLPKGDARLGTGLLNVGSGWLKHRRADLAEPLLEEALALWQASYIETPQHREIVTAAGWLVSCLLVRAAAGEDTHGRTERARQLCEAYGFDYAQRVELAKQYPYAPQERGWDGA